MYNLKKRREAAGLSQSQLAKKSGIRVRMIQAFEAEAASVHRDINKAAAMTVWKLAEALDCDVIDILEPDLSDGCEE